ncbi:MAG TPA: IS1 family transposase [Burkholderiales bacterium]|nr:IS1 family transposase [Burkholderiales bacterium]
MNRLGLQDRARIIGCLTEGMSMRATTRLCDVSINTVTKLLVDVGTACDLYQNETLRNLPCKRVQVDEIWSFCGMKEKNVPPMRRGELGYGDVYTWVAIDADTKLVPSWLIGQRWLEYAKLFIDDLASRMANRVQLTSDGHTPYLTAVEGSFGRNIDYAMLVKLYSNPATNIESRRYSPGECCGARKNAVCGNPDEKHISTSFVERQNLTMRMHMRRFTRLTNGFSRKVENHCCAVALHYMFYNFARIHKTLRVTPAMQAGISDHVWTLEEIAALAS